MKGTRWITVLLWLGTMALPLLGHAEAFNAVQVEKSTLAFTFKQMNVSVDGRFRKFSAQLAFDPDRIADASVSLEVDLASIDTGSSDGDGEVAGKQWFNTKLYPVARFVSTTLKTLTNGRYEALGQLSIKGRTRDVVVPLSVAISGRQASFDGTLMLKRADFAIGEGDWADFGVIANEVRVSFHMVATSSR